jgi:phage gp46-like protein
MKDRRQEVDKHVIEQEQGDIIIEPGWWADKVLEVLPRDMMMCKPIIIGKDEDGYVVEWCYNSVIFTLARAKKIDKVFGNLEVYAVQKIEKIIPKSEVESD